MFKQVGTSREIFVNQDEGMFIAFPITLDASVHTLETYTRNGRTIVRGGSLVKEGTVNRGVLAEDYDITEGPAAARIVIRGYAYASRLTNAALDAIASGAFPEIFPMPIKTVVVALRTVNGLKVTLGLEGAKWAAGLAAGNFTVSGGTIASVAVDAVENTAELTITAAGTINITAIASAAFVGGTGSTLKGLPISATVEA